MPEQKNPSSASKGPAAPRGGYFLRSVEFGLAVLGALDCVGVAGLFTSTQLGQQLWPLPGLYFVEISLLGITAFLAVARNGSQFASRWSALPWIAAGILATFFVLGGFSIGPSLGPGMLAFLVAGILQDIRQRGDWPRHFMLFMLAALLQGGLMFAMVFVQGPYL